MNLKSKVLRTMHEIKGRHKYRNDEYMRKYIKSKSEVKGGEFSAVTMTAQVAMDELIDFFLGKDWGAKDKTVEELNAIAVYEIENRFYYCKEDDDKKIIKNLETLDAQKALNELSNFFLGKNWYIVDPLCNLQSNPIVVIEIEEKYYYCKKDDWED